MLNQKYFGLPLWVWLLIMAIIVIYYKNSNNSAMNETFAETSKPQIKVMNFNTSWCGWSKRFQPEWDDFSNRVKLNPNLSNVDAQDVKCDKTENESMCESYQIPGYPSVVIEVNGVRHNYEGERTADALTNHVIQLN
jgi:thiol-disulfide isomerase/thioredoxin